MTDHAPRRPLFAEARAKVSVAAYVERCGVKLVRAGADQRGACVLCSDDAGARSEKFRVFDGAEKWACYGCDRFGDVVDLVAAHRRCDGLVAARWLLGEDVAVSAPAVRRAKVEASGPSASDRIALEIWAGVKPLAGTLAERYLLGRGIAPKIVAEAGENLRYHGMAKHHWDAGEGRWIHAPAMVAQVVVCGPDGEPVPTGGTHVTYLDRKGGKSSLAPAKKMWGPQALYGRPGGAWLIGPDGSFGEWGGLVVAEGIETALSVATLALRSGTALRACAALSLNRLQGGMARDADGCIDPFHVQADPASPAFVWSAPPGEVMVCVDRDMADQRVRVKTPRRGACDMRLTAEVRARICGTLAVAAWKAAGAGTVRAIAPPPGMDFNDQLRRVLARECAA